MIRILQASVPDANGSRKDLLASPNHGHRSRETAAHVERKEFFHVLDLARTGLLFELLICFKHLPNAGRSYRMAVADQATACVHRNFERRPGFFRPHLRQRVAPLFTSSAPLPGSASPR